MNLINVSQFKRAQIILRINAFVLFLLIVFTPYLVSLGAWGLSESTVESIFLMLEIIILIRLFRNYDFYSNKSEQKITKLSDRLEEQQKLLSDSFEYLGRVNVRMSITKQIMDKLKTVSKKNRLEYIISEMLQIINGMIDTEDIILKMVDLTNQKTIQKFAFNNNYNFARKIKNISNKNLCDNKLAKKISKKNEIQIISSNYNNFFLKTFVLFPSKTEESMIELKEEKFELIQDIVNQCEIIFLISNSKYYKK